MKSITEKQMKFESNDALNAFLAENPNAYVFYLSPQENGLYAQIRFVEENV